MRIKVCGMRDYDNILSVEELGIDIMGFIFYDKSPRFFLDGGKHEYMPSKCKRAGVFVNMETDNIIDIAREMHLDYIQLHGDESPQECKTIKENGYRVIKAFHIETQDDIKNIQKEYSNYCDMFLFDTKCKTYGGCGRQFDWHLLDMYNGDTPFLLSGGIDRNSIKNIKEIRNPHFIGVDLNSGFESSPAIKDIVRLEEFIVELKKMKI